MASMALAGTHGRRNIGPLALALVSVGVLFYSAYVASIPIPALNPSGGLNCGSLVTVTATMTHDIGPCVGDGLDVSTGSTLLDCAGHSIVGIGSNAGISIASLKGVTVRNCKITGFEDGFHIENSTSVYLSGNEATGNANGFYLSRSSSNYITGNLARNNSVGYELVSGSSSNTLTGNTASGNPNGFYLGGSSDSNNLYDNYVNGSTNGFYLAGSSSNNALYGNYGNDNSIGFLLTNSTQNTLAENTANGNQLEGFLLDSSSHDNALTSNEADNNANYGYIDLSLGTLTVGTANTYSLNNGQGNGVGGSSPPGLCLQPQ